MYTCTSTGMYNLVPKCSAGQQRHSSDNRNGGGGNVSPPRQGTTNFAEHHWFLGFWFCLSGVKVSGGTRRQDLDGGDDHQQVGDVADTVQKVGRDAGQVLVGELARGEDVDHVGRLL